MNEETETLKILDRLSPPRIDPWGCHIPKDAPTDIRHMWVVGKSLLVGVRGHNKFTVGIDLLTICTSSDFFTGLELLGVLAGRFPSFSRKLANPNQNN